MADETLVHGRVTNLPTRTLVPPGIEQLSQQVQILNSIVLAIQEQLRSFQYNQ